MTARSSGTGPASSGTSGAVTSHIGPIDIWNKVWVAPDIETAQQVFQEQAKPGFNDGLQIKKVGTGSSRWSIPSVGNENFGWSACNEKPDTEYFEFCTTATSGAGNVVA